MREKKGILERDSTMLEFGDDVRIPTLKTGIIGELFAIKIIDTIFLAFDGKS